MTTDGRLESRGLEAVSSHVETDAGVLAFSNSRKSVFFSLIPFIEFRGSVKYAMFHYIHGTSQDFTEPKHNPATTLSTKLRLG